MHALVDKIITPYFAAQMAKLGLQITRSLSGRFMFGQSTDQRNFVPGWRAWHHPGIISQLCTWRLHWCRASMWCWYTVHLQTLAETLVPWFWIGTANTCNTAVRTKSTTVSKAANVKHLHVTNACAMGFRKERNRNYTTHESQHLRVIAINSSIRTLPSIG